MVTVDTKTKKSLPKYLEINKILRKQIHEGQFSSGCRMPAEMDLANEYGVSRDTARQALSILEKEGYIHRRAGQGTFVRQLKEDGNPLIKLEHLCFLFIDVSPQIDYQLAEISAAERWLSEYHISISLATLKSEDLVHGQFPSVFQKGLVQGILIDGAVEEFHLEIPKKYDLPFLIVGSHDLDQRYPQVRYSVDKMAEKAVGYLHSLNPGKPVLLLVEPFKYYYTKMIFSGYCRGVRQVGLEGPVLQVCENDDGYTVLKEHVARCKKTEFSVITTDRILPGILQLYAELGLSMKMNPILVIGNPERINHRDKSFIHLMPICADQIAIEAARQFKLMYETGNKEVCVELESEIIPPSEIL